MRSEVKDLIKDLGLTKNQDWSGIWERGFMPQFTTGELMLLAQEIQEQRFGRFSRDMAYSHFVQVCIPATKAVEHHTAHWPFFAWFDGNPWPEVQATLLRLLVVEITRRAADAKAKESHPSPEESRPSDGGIPG